MNSNELRVSHGGGPGSWQGVIRRGRQIVWTCPHSHSNRDDDGASSAARPCAALVLEALVDREKAVKTLVAVRESSIATHYRYEWMVKRHLWSIQRREWALAEADTVRGSMLGPVVRP